ncbi:MAG TPA: alkaline phosphatase family protein, partial [Acidimicrobiia bacterium]|nr:alkaline phosphatase family protein [Acidimicrobiia bacterium]
MTLHRTRRSRLALVTGLVACLALVAGAAPVTAASPQPNGTRVTGGPTGTYVVPPGVHKIQHVIVIQQENRSFDTYFGTYPGADGIPMKNGQPTVCVNDPATGKCEKPSVDHADANGGGPHSEKNATADVNGGKMDGFVAQAESGRRGCLDQTNPACTNSAVPDVMGYHTRSDIPNYWTYAGDFVLQDHMFQPNASWSFPEHLYLVSEWSAKCSRAADPMSCVSNIDAPGDAVGAGAGKINGDDQAARNFAWTSLPYLLYTHNVSWKYYVAEGTTPDCEDDAATCPPKQQRVGTPDIWNPLPGFTDVRKDGQVGNVQTINNFYADAKAGNLPAVSWVTPNGAVSEHPPGLVSAGQA